MVSSVGAVINCTWSLSLGGVSCASPGDTAVGASSLGAPSAAGVCVDWWSTGTIGECSSVSLAPGVTSVARSSVRLRLWGLELGEPSSSRSLLARGGDFMPSVGSWLATFLLLSGVDSVGASAADLVAWLALAAFLACLVLVCGMLEQRCLVRLLGQVESSEPVQMAISGGADAVCLSPVSGLNGCTCGSWFVQELDRSIRTDVDREMNWQIQQHGWKFWKGRIVL